MQAPIFKLHATDAAIRVGVRVPGTIVTTNGQRANKGVVKWAFSSEAAGVRDVVLTVEYRPDGR